MTILLVALERHGELALRKAQYSLVARRQLLQMSAATIDRYLAPAHAQDPLRVSVYSPGRGRQK